MSSMNASVLSILCLGTTTSAGKALLKGIDSSNNDSEDNLSMWGEKISDSFQRSQVSRLFARSVANSNTAHHKLE